MARILANQQNISAPDGDYLYGRIKDDDGTNDGTPVNEKVYGDIHQFFARLAAMAGITLNDLPDNEYSGFQFYEALSQLAIYNTTSKDSKTIGLGSFVFTVDPNLAYQVGNSVRIQDAGNTANFMYGYVTAYSGNSLTVHVISYWGSGTISNWKINLASGYMEPNIAATLVNSYVSGAGINYRKDSLGNVILLGEIQSPASVTSAVFFTLPVGYRPPVNMQFYVGDYTSSQNDCICYVETTGECRLYTNNGGGGFVTGSKQFNLAPVRFNVNS